MPRSSSRPLALLAAAVLSSLAVPHGATARAQETAPPAATEPAPATGELVLPTCRLGLPPHAGDVARLEILSSGLVRAGGDVLYDPRVDGGPEGLAPWLAGTASEMRKEKPGETLPAMPAEPLVLEVDESAPFRSVQHVMAACAAPDVMIWKLDLAVREPGGGRARLPVPLPMDLHGDVTETLEVVIRVVRPGAKLGPDGDPWTGEGRHLFGEDRELEYGIGPMRAPTLAEAAARARTIRMANPELALVVDARAGVTTGEVVALLDATLETVSVPIRFTGAL